MAAGELTRTSPNLTFFQMWSWMSSSGLSLAFCANHFRKCLIFVIACRVFRACLNHKNATNPL
eukprot:CAMPEP_0115362446 /NCGR_PEP_ID=MMETSP0270-20121206/102710_1 /TAXON_ID=71861 /ORGANISM="Scrippsiella trochoidea, Strain CCMP3099" /LENGTH=62 /DNA_ID=CAMNT_0002785019 /DNA_START=40 /DNA_END=228 /DNA_ORIENTATION=+